ncbi:hypothetical protein TP70_04220 [Staphylococcus microti]|uniref:Uncharacterized protein n=1 Tax=Staphylococcus microti TaxID=569857 RepID=A0A0D6XQP8_9STAP|nr:hypothetical protein [Staphylococcus microti]KIX91154.1 hypothetical protein TP70_04220 [Staphylococcus microti]PNZ75740.1 hypothetical protein CD132_11880 [Staphylococcus microti]SUM58248.1 Uncharacterised protein [Staphylococcus microti]
MIIDKLESYTFNIDQLAQRSVRRHLKKLLTTVTFQTDFQFHIVKLNDAYFLRVQLPKQALPYFVSLLSFHNFSIYQLVLTEDAHTLTPMQHVSPNEQHYELVIDGLTDPFIKDKVIDVLSSFQGDRILYNFSHHRLKVTATPTVMMALIRTLATRHIDIYYASLPQRTHHQSRIS